MTLIIATENVFVEINALFHYLVTFTYGLLMFTGVKTNGYGKQILSIIRSLAFHVDVFVVYIS